MPWIDTFSTSLHAEDAARAFWGHEAFVARRIFRNCTLRQSFRVTLGSKRIRLRFSNAFSDTPLTLGRVTVGRTVQLGTPDVASTAEIAFGGRPDVEIPPHATWTSDPLDYPTHASEDLTVSIFLPGKDGNTAAAHEQAKTTSYVALGDHTTLTLPIHTLRDFTRWYFVEAIEAELDGRALVCLGDSITDAGDRLWDHAYNGWANLLFKRMQQKAPDVAVLNAGISGDQFWEGGLARLDRDVFKPGVKWVLVLMGTNDIGAVPDLPEDQEQLSRRLITGFEQLLERAHARGIQVIPCTILPRMSPEDVRLGLQTHREYTRQRVNEWIKRRDHVDWAAALAGDDPRIMREDYRFSDFVHPNQKGNRKMADMIDLSRF